MNFYLFITIILKDRVHSLMVQMFTNYPPHTGNTGIFGIKDDDGKGSRHRNENKI